MMLPPIVAMLRICGDAVSDAACATAAQRAFTSSLSASSVSVTPDPMITLPSCSRSSCSSGTFLRKTKSLSSRTSFFSSGMMSVPPPIYVGCSDVTVSFRLVRICPLISRSPSQSAE